MVDAGSQPTFEEKNESDPLGLKRLVPNYYFAFSCRPLGAMWGGGGTAVAMQV